MLRQITEDQFAFAAGVIIGFLLTGVRAWTGLETPRGPLLAALAALWLARDGDWVDVAPTALPSGGVILAIDANGRWVVRRKAEVVAAVNGGLLTIDEVCERYSLTLEEFASWQRAVDRSGMQGLRVTRIQHYRDLYERQLKY